MCSETRKSHPATFLFALLICITVPSIHVFAQSPSAAADAGCKGSTSPVPQIFGGGNPGSSSSGLNPLSGFFGNMAAAGGNYSGIQPIVAQGMCQLSKIMQQHGGDPQRAMMTFVQTPDGQALMRVPGALSLLTEWFNAVMALPSGREGGFHPAEVQHSSRSQPRIDTSQGETQPTNQVANGVGGSLTPPFLEPYRPNAYGPGINSDAAGRPFVWQPEQGPPDPLAKVQPDVFGPGIGMDQYGRPVHAACPPYQSIC